MERYYQRSRLAKKEEKTAYKRLFLVFIISFLILIFSIFMGIPALINMAIFLSNFKTDGETNFNPQTIFLFPPTLETPFEATNTAKLKITGSAQPQTRVEIFLNGDLFKKFLVSSEGKFTVDNIPLKIGENKIWAYAENDKNQKSERSNVLKVLYKKTQPKIEILEPEDNAVISNETKTVKISGLTEEVETLTINERYVILDKDGNFSLEYPLNDGDNNLKFTATDIAGNSIIIERKVTFHSP